MKSCNRTWLLERLPQTNYCHGKHCHEPKFSVAIATFLWCNISKESVVYFLEHKIHQELLKLALMLSKMFCLLRASFFLTSNYISPCVNVVEEKNVYKYWVLQEYVVWRWWEVASPTCTCVSQNKIFLHFGKRHLQCILIIPLSHRTGSQQRPHSTVILSSKGNLDTRVIVTPIIVAGELIWAGLFLSLDCYESIQKKHTR